MASDYHDTLVYRLSQMLVKLNQGESLDPRDLAEEFGVTLRTIQRDLNERFAYLPLQKNDGRYQLDPACLGQLSTRDIERFASLAGVRGLFPSLSDDFLRSLFDARIESAVLVKGHNYENLGGKETLFREIEKAIVSRRKVMIDYRKDDDFKSYEDLAPYRLINQKGIWYLAALDNGKIKTFAFTRIASMRALEASFDPDPELERRINEEDGVWMADRQVEVVLKVSSLVAGFFKRRRLIANQVIEKEMADGGLIVSAKVGHANQVIPIVRYWIPHIRIISPEELQTQLEADLRLYAGAGTVPRSS